MPDRISPAAGAAPTLLESLRHWTGATGAAPALLYFDRTLSWDELDRLSDRLAGALQADGFRPGDRLAAMLQNMPQFVIAMVAAWKAGGALVTVNPMNQARELEAILRDSRPHSLIVLESLRGLADPVCAKLGEAAPHLIGVADAAMQTRHDPRLFAKPAAYAEDDLARQIARGVPVHPVAVKPGEAALLVYTSGTTGLPKAAVLSHANIACNAREIAGWYGLDSAPGPILGIAPLFHVTGLIGHVALALACGAPVVLCWRFDPSLVRDTVREHRPVFTIGAITAYVALMNLPDIGRADFTSFRAMVSGGAPVPPALVEQFRALSGHYIHNGYGLTETSAGVIAVPFGQEAPVDPDSGTLAVGVPTGTTRVWIADDDGNPLPIGEPGEIVIQGHTVAQGYWQRPDDTAAAMRQDGFRTGDIGFVDAQGWIYLVDRKKDMINASGYKVWPREVEDVLYTHPAVREAAVVGVADAYRGESVRAVLSLRVGQAIDPDAMRAWCRERMAAYKVPREVLVMDDLPKTSTGKILRRALRGEGAPGGG